MKTLVAAMCALFVVIAGCKDDDSNCVTCPDQTLRPTLQNIWPNADKTTWTYHYEMREWGGDITIYPTLQQVPTTPLPTWAQIFDLVESHAPKEPYTTIPWVYTMQFDGTITTLSGVTAQNLKTDLTVEPGEAFEQHAANRTPALWRRLYAARPDLRKKLLSRLSQNSEDTSGPSIEGALGFSSGGLGGRSAVTGLLVQEAEWPLLIHGDAWEKTVSWIGTYGDLDQRLLWKFLTDKLSRGSEFSYQVFPSVASDVVLHCRVYRQFSVTTDAGTFEKALDCLYILDWGVTAVTDVYGEVIGYMRDFDYGRVIYAPTIGPVYSYERWAVEPGNPPSDGFFDITLKLIDSSTLGD